MNDEETVALIAGGHTFGKMHGARKAADCVGKEPGGAALEEQGLGWKNTCGKGHSEDTVTSGLEGAWTQAPTRWTSLYLQNLLGFEWQLTRSPNGAVQWIPTDESAHQSVPDAHIKGKYHAPVMTTADMALKHDPEYRAIAEKFLADPAAYRLAFAKAWFKLTHRDMGPKARYVGNRVPSETLLWQDPVSSPEYDTISRRNQSKLKRRVLDSGLSISELVRVAWASASSFRASDMRGGANGARIALAPQNQWAVNQPTEIAKVLKVLQGIRADFGEDRVSLADLIVLAGGAAIEKAAADAGVDVEVPFEEGRGDAIDEQTDLNSFSLLEPSADAFRNYYNAATAYRPPTEMLVDRADQLNLTVPEMTALIGGMRVLGANAAGSKHGMFSGNTGTLSNEFFTNLLDMRIVWQKSEEEGVYEGLDRNTGSVMFTATPVDLIFGSNSELRAVAEVYAYDNSQERFVNDFVKAWSKVMQLDRF